MMNFTVCALLYCSDDKPLKDSRLQVGKRPLEIRFIY